MIYICTHSQSAMNALNSIDAMTSDESMSADLKHPYATPNKVDTVAAAKKAQVHTHTHTHTHYMLCTYCIYAADAAATHMPASGGTKYVSAD